MGDPKELGDGISADLEEVLADLEEGEEDQVGMLEDEDLAAGLLDEEAEEGQEAGT